MFSAPNAHLLYCWETEAFLFLFCIINIFLQTLYHGATQAMLQCFNLLEHDLYFLFFFITIMELHWFERGFRLSHQYLHNIYFLFFLIISITESRWLCARRFKLSHQYLYNFFCFFPCHQHHGAPLIVSDALSYLNTTFTMFFTVECSLKLLSFGCRVNTSNI